MIFSLPDKLIKIIYRAHNEYKCAKENLEFIKQEQDLINLLPILEKRYKFTIFFYNQLIKKMIEIYMIPNKEKLKIPFIWKIDYLSNSLEVKDKNEK